ncbi:NAD(P)/FAD-dependent oxidoreductase [Pseudoduganella ginsengisoli]|uniref:NADH dehydrogenase FAD-containing subunit n=1 Tax=Pseudoduganella ginsengisoli TaxID=1462440 RepID=A0A6L6PXV3_9BURK|nr:NAD(P)/FAD-dependent oxidoreductase [Pseudoduganella ginsengisoli]MTW01532.1 NADH dehydrogenase FAD-containing subunit [Pseudoduganella ginsengisoli]
MQTIVIVGGGAGGLELATRLGDTMGRKGRAKIILVDRSPTHFWKPLLHTVASGKRDPQVFQIEYSAQAAEHGFQFIHAEMRSVDRASRTLELAPCMRDDGIAPPARTLEYSTLVLALGAVTNFYGVPGAAGHVCTLDHVGDAKGFYRRFLGACVRASQGGGEKVNVMIVGGGATGVELAAELAHSARALARYKVHTLDPARDVRISILERGSRILPHLPPEMSARAEKYLASRGIEVCTGAAVTSVEADTIHVDGVPRPATMTLWAAGVEGPAISKTFGLSLGRMRQIMVNASLQSVDDPNVFAIGDCASFVCPVKGAAPPRAQVAHQQAVFLAGALARREGAPLPEFRYRDYGSLVSLGPVAAVGVLFGGSVARQLPVSGATANLLYGMMYQKHLMALHGVVRAAAVMLVDWLRKRITPSVKLH